MRMFRQGSTEIALSRKRYGRVLIRPVACPRECISAVQFNLDVNFPQSLLATPSSLLKVAPQILGRKFYKNTTKLIL